MQDETPYQLIGGAEKVRELVDRFYDHMDNLPEAREIRALHAKSLRGSREKLFLFLSGWLGGPDLYVQKYGHPRLRMRHMPFAIGRRERDQWMLCMRRALDDMDLDSGLRNYLEQAFWRTADHMRNQPEADIGNADTLPIFAGPAPGRTQQD
jgi:hemoglobin